ncbi:MAG: hypothetical protein LBH57_10085 [Treponema sp.]|jgi:hypothetical protein|nr:hypothetical protein [Treponema sp.]
MGKGHNERYSELQDEYLRTRDGKCLSLMYGVCVEIAGNYIRKYARKRRLSLDAGELAHDSAVYVIDQYLRKPRFRVGRISAYIHYGCVKSLFRDKEWDRRKAPYEESLLAAAVTEDPPEEAPEQTWKQGLLFEEA